MADEPKRLTDEYRAILTPDEALQVDTRRVVAKAIGTGQYRELDLTKKDSDEFVATCRERIERLSDRDPKSHILFKGLPKNALLNPLSEEALYWDIESDEPLDPKAAQAILDLYQAIEDLPPEVHKLKFPFFMTGYMIGHSTRVAIMAALLAQRVNKDGVGYKIDPALAAKAGLIHDIGKLEPDQKKLVKTGGRFSPSQFEKVHVRSYFVIVPVPIDEGGVFFKRPATVDAGIECGAGTTQRTESYDYGCIAKHVIGYFMPNQDGIRVEFRYTINF